jgi:DNA invertase Pin-like site-specific DNA recombinase
MANGRFISYLRVSTERQGASGLGLDAQRAAVRTYLDGGRWQLVTEITEIESGADNDRPKLAEAFALCRIHGACLVIAKLDRLSRDAAFLLSLQSASVRFVCADMPDANEMTVGIMAVVAQAERKMISTRTKAALAAAKARGKVLGKPKGYQIADAAVGRAKGSQTITANARARAADLQPVIEAARAAGAHTQRAVATYLNERSIPAPAGGSWSGSQVGRVFGRLG